MLLTPRHFWPLLFLTAAAQAAVPVEERGGSTGVITGMAPPKQVVNAPAESASPQPASGVAALFNELQLLREELQTLRGEVERQNYRIKQLEAKQDEQYRDIDRRLATLATTATPAPPPAGGGEGASGTPTSGDGNGRQIVRSTQVPADEQGAYEFAFNAMKAREFDSSIEQFGVFVQTYPNGDYTPNAFYWLGELHLAKTDTEQARQSFAQLINLYPEHQKVPDALYKMGVVYHRLGDSRRALEYLGRVRTEHPNSSAAGLAETYAAELQ